MKKIIFLSVIVVVGVMAALLLRNRCGQGWCVMSKGKGVDLVFVNDSQDTISCSYKGAEKEVNQVLKPGDEVTNGRGFLRIFTNRDGFYELSYPFPRPTDAMQRVTLSQITTAAQQKKNLGESEYGEGEYTEKGMLGDIKIEYEQVREIS